VLIYGGIDTSDVLFIYIDKCACEISNSGIESEGRGRDEGQFNVLLTVPHAVILGK
jgi:hypothetical protein